MTPPPNPARAEASEQTDRYHKRPFTGFAPRDEKRRKQIVTLPMDVLMAIVRERLEYLHHGSDLDAVAQNTACEIERAMGVFPNLEGTLSAAPAPAGGDVREAAYRSAWNEAGNQPDYDSAKALLWPTRYPNRNDRRDTMPRSSDCALVGPFWPLIHGNYIETARRFRPAPSATASSRSRRRRPARSSSSRSFPPFRLQSRPHRLAI